MLFASCIFAPTLNQGVVLAKPFLSRNRHIDDIAQLSTYKKTIGVCNSEALYNVHVIAHFDWLLVTLDNNM